MGASVTSVLIVSCAETGLVTALRQNDGPSEPINHPLVETRSLRQAGGRANGLGVNIVPNRVDGFSFASIAHSSPPLIAVSLKPGLFVPLQRDASMERQGGAVS